MLKAKYAWSTRVDGIIPDNQIYQVILSNRGIDDPEHFFTMGKEVLHDPFLMKGMKEAVQRIHKAIELNEKIVIYGDYDCDGITSISVLVRALRKLNANVTYDLPDRFLDGYGLNLKAVQNMIEDNVKLVITVDNGITCVEEVAALKAAGIDTIITDHHEVKAVLPDAFQIIHAKVSPDYPFKEIAGVMTAYKLASALLDDPLEELFDLVMIGTIADLMPLENENQAMVNLGLIQLGKSSNLGLCKLIEYSHLDLINETAIAFKIAPKINSSGRLGKAKEAVALLISDSEKEVNDLIYQIEENHANRKDLTEDAFQLCENLIDPIQDVLVVHSPLLHEGVIGICAQKLAEKYQKSTVVITFDEEGTGKGSMRSFGGENILKMLEQNKGLLLKFGGHSQAAGLQIAKENIDLFQKGLQSCSTRSENPVLDIDMEVALSDLTIPTIKKLSDNSFFTALFLFKNVNVIKKMKMSDKHTKLLLESNGEFIEALHFNSLEYYYHLEIGDQISLVGGLNINKWQKRQSIQIMIKDVECHDFQVLDLRDPKEFQIGQNWLKSYGYPINDALLLDYQIKTILREQKPSTIILLPRTNQTMIDKAVNKETYRTIYKLFPDNHVITLFELEKKTKLSLWMITKVLDVFIELDLVRKNSEGYQKVLDVTKKELAVSKTYQQVESFQKLIHWMYEDSINNIKKTLKVWMEEYNEI